MKRVWCIVLMQIASLLGSNVDPKQLYLDFKSAMERAGIQQEEFRVLADSSEKLRKITLSASGAGSIPQRFECSPTIDPAILTFFQFIQARFQDPNIDKFDISLDPNHVIQCTTFNGAGVYGLALVNSMGRSVSFKKKPSL